MGYRYFDDQRLWDLTVEVFTRNGYSRSDCEDIANVLLASDRMGIESHGVQRMKLYTHSLEIGRIKRGAKSEIVRETPVSAVIDAHDAIGQPVSVAAMQMAIDKAKKAGVGIVVVRDSNHYGIAGYYAKMAADQGLLGISMTNTEALVVPADDGHEPHRRLHARHAASVPSRHGHERGTCRKDGGLRQGGQDPARRLAHEFGRLSQL